MRVLADVAASVSIADSAATEAASDAASNMGTLGDFRIQREIGRGGMGIVYEAEQISLSRRVALKVLPFAAILDPRQLQRFKNEARAAAPLKHPNIVSVYGVGCDRAVHFYAMEFVERQTPARLIEERRKASGVDRKGVPRGGAERSASRVGQLSRASVPARSTSRKQKGSHEDPTIGFLEELAQGERADAPCPAPTDAPTPLRGREFFRSVARLGIQAAEALEHAHPMSVVHRHVKPSNLMVPRHPGSTGRARSRRGVTPWRAPRTRRETRRGARRAGRRRPPGGPRRGLRPLWGCGTCR